MMVEEPQTTGLKNDETLGFEKDVVASTTKMRLRIHFKKFIWQMEQPKV